MSVGGSLESVTINGRNFAVAADADGNRKIGGSENEVQANGDGTVRLIKSTVPSSITGLTYAVNDDRGDQEFLQDIADGNSFVPVAATYPDGSVYQGTMQITGELNYSNQSATASFDLMGVGKLTKQ